MPSIFAYKSISFNLNSVSARSSSRPLAGRPLNCHVSCQKCSGEAESPFRTVGTVSISYSELKDKSWDLSPKIEEGFGPNGLGIISVSEVPGFSDLRQTLLNLSPRIASLPNDVRNQLEDPDSRYNFGWSHGKEKLESGKFDTYKGSFYANPVLDVPTTDVSLIQRYPHYCRPNIWPTDALPNLESAFKALGKLMQDVGLLLAYHCDHYVSKAMKTIKDDHLQQILMCSRCHKGRLLYYFAKQQSESMKDTGVSSWCGWHTDHGSLTGNLGHAYDDVLMREGCTLLSYDASSQPNHCPVQFKFAQSVDKLYGLIGFGVILVELWSCVWSYPTIGFATISWLIPIALMLWLCSVDP